MKNRLAKNAIFTALAGLLFLVPCIAPAVQVAGNSSKSIGAPPALDNSGAGQFDNMLSASLDRGFSGESPPLNSLGEASMSPSFSVQGKGDNVLAPQATYTFENANLITIPNSGAGSPYPSNIQVTQIPDPIFKVTVLLNRISHSFPDDIDVLLVGPQGQKVILMSDAGGEFDINQVVLTFDDAASSFLPNFGQIVGGVYRPTNHDLGSDTFPPPAPAGPYSTTLSSFAGTNANGFWNLYVADDTGGDFGDILLGWRLTIETLAVTNTDDSGTGSLRQAIINANSNPDLSTVPFRIPAAGPHEILLSSALPTITSPVILDATTQSSYAGFPLVYIKANAFLTFFNGLTIASGGCTIKGLQIREFYGTGIYLDDSGGNTIQGCSIWFNTEHGIYVGPGSANNLIGGTTAAARNVISGNGQYGIVLGSSGQVVQGNYIGTNYAGTTDLGNGSNGIGVFGTNMTIGGTTPGAGNVISGNDQNGILVVNFGSNVTITGNYIGTNAAGTADLGNSLDGILINGTSFNTIGGTTVEARNVISGNDQNGITITGAASGNLIYGNYIGTDSTGAFAVGNSSDGVEINNTSNATVGGTVVGARNVISGNSGNGIFITNASGNTVQGNYIGASAGGGSSVGNVMTGIFMEVSDNNLIGGTTAAARNVISGNGQYGIVLGSSGQVIQGNYIGTDVTGNGDLGNARDGIAMFGFNAQIGGTTAGERNIISGNNENGIQLAGSASANVIEGNYIGVGANGTSAIGNTLNGVLLNGTSNNSIGGTAAGTGNIISGNGSCGVEISGSVNQVQGNYIGTNAAGTASLGNTADGVTVLSGASNNTIGGTITGARNIISGNGGDGVEISGSNSNLVQANLIGTDVTGTVDLGNSLSGVLITTVGATMASSNLIGGTIDAARNVISGNNRGIEIRGPGSSQNSVQGNYIGTNAAGTAALGNSLYGVTLHSGAFNNTIGGTTPGTGNVISGNAADGIRLSGGVFSNNVVQGNYIGTNATGTSALGNSNLGVSITASGNVIGGTIEGAANTIAFNSGGGVSVLTGESNAILSNSIYSNDFRGINLGFDGITLNDSCDGDFGANSFQNFPVITSAIISSGTTTIEGTLNSTASTSFTIQFFSSSAADPTGYGEGQAFIGSTTVTTNASCNASFTFNPASAVPVGSFITATATDSLNNTSEFSLNRQVALPTAIEFAGATATGFADGVLIEWQTGMEVDNLGFNLYREESGERTRVNQQLLAGSALTVGQGVVIRSGFSYSWWDDKPANKDASYWIEDVDLSGLSLWHGPFYTKQTGGKPSVHSQAISLSQIGRTNDTAATHSLEEFAQLARTSQSVASPVSLQQVSLASSPAIKIGVKQARWYRVTQAELIAVGLDPGTDPRTLRLFVDGIELPILVAGEEDGRFDPNDAVEFYGRGLNTPSTDTRVYWLIGGSQPGLRINKTPFTEGYPAGESFAHTVERRDRTIYFSALRNGDKENFFGAVISSTPIEQRLTLNNLAPATRESAIIEVSLQGVTNLAHQVSVSLNGSLIGQLFFNGQSKGQQKIDVAQSQLREGENVITLQSLNGPSDISLVDSILINYQHTYRADSDTLRFTEKAGQSVTINGFSAKDIRVFDVTDERHVQELTLSIGQTKDGYSATVTAASAPGVVSGVGGTAAAERRLLALTGSKASKALTIKANSTSQLLDATNGADFIIISAAGLLDSLKPLAELRRKQGLSTSLVDIEDIYDEFSFGNKSPQSIRDFLSFAAASWKIKPRFVLFAGDASYDARNYLGLGAGDLVPTKLIDTAYMETSSDDWFADFNEDGIANLSTGRLPVRSAEEAFLVVNKLIAYEQLTPSNEVLLVADSNDGFDFEGASTSLSPLIPSNIRVSEIFRSRSGDAGARTQLLEAINRGQKIVNYTGHGSQNVWRGNLLTAGDAQLLTNRDHLSLFLMLTCLNGYFVDAQTEGLSEALLKSQGGGAVAVWASTGLTFPESQSELARELYRQLFSSKLIRIGDAVLRAKQRAVDMDVRRTWTLLGDPTMIVR